MCASAISTERCVSVWESACVCVRQWLIAVLAQQLWGSRPHCDVSVAMETARAEEGLRWKRRKGEGGRWGTDARGEEGKKILLFVQFHVFVLACFQRNIVCEWMCVCVLRSTHHLSRTDSVCTVLSQTDNLRQTDKRQLLSKIKNNLVSVQLASYTQRENCTKITCTHSTFIFSYSSRLPVWKTLIIYYSEPAVKFTSMNCENSGNIRHQGRLYFQLDDFAASRRATGRKGRQVWLKMICWLKLIQNLNPNKGNGCF